MSNQNVYRYDSPVIYSSEELEIIKKLVGFIRQYKGVYSGLPVLEAQNAIGDYCRVANMKCTVDLFKQCWTYWRASHIEVMCCPIANLTDNVRN